MEGNATVIGIEAEHTGQAGVPWPAPQLDAYRKLSAAILKQLGTTASFMCGHKEWAPTRKIDPIGLNMHTERALVGALMTGDDDMDDARVRLLALEPIIQALQWQTVAWYQNLQAKTGTPGGNAAYWGSDNTGARPSIEEWQAEATKLHAAALRIGASVGPTGATGPQGPKGDPGPPGGAGVTEGRVKEIVAATKLIP
jgi:hypothetical protein